MKKWKRCLLWVFCGLVLLVTLAVEFVPQPDAITQLLAIQDSSHDFRSQEASLTDLERELLGEASAIKKIILPKEGTPFLFSAIDGTRNRHAVHDPRYCFVGAGWQIVSEQTLTTPRGEMQALTLEREGKQHYALYWFNTPNHWFVSPMEFWAKATWRRLSFGIGGEEPILMIVQSLGDEPLDDAATIKILEALDPWKS